jgi:hypothetical protein
MLTLHPAKDRFHTRIGWLDSRHAFSFGEHYDPARTGFRDLLVLNEDRVAPEAGFPPHAHRDMEIISYVLEGALAHRDSMGNGSVMRPGDVQRMSAGTGVVHSEYNAEPDGATHFLQIWIRPATRGQAPGYEQTHFPAGARRNRWTLVAAEDGRDGALTVHQDVALYASLLEAGRALRQQIAPGRHAWLQVARGTVEVGGRRLEAGDAAALTDEREVVVAAETDAELLLFDLR